MDIDAHSQQKIPIYTPTIYSVSAHKAIDSTWISSHGKYVELATKQLQSVTGAKHAILMANGTVATHCAMMAIKYKFPTVTRIYVPNNVYVAVWNAALMSYPIESLEVMRFDHRTLNIDTSADYIRSLAPNSAVLIVHNLGGIVNIPRLKNIRPDLVFVEDACEGIFGAYENSQVGGSSALLASSVSFFGNKTITCGEGGAFLTNHTDVYDFIKRVHSQGTTSERFVHDILAYNYRMTNVQAAFLHDQLIDIVAILDRKKSVFATYERLFHDLIKSGKVSMPENESDTTRANWMFAIRIPTASRRSIQLTYEYFINKGIETRPFFYPYYSHAHLKNMKSHDIHYKNINSQVLMLPSSPTLTEADQQRVVDTVADFIAAQETWNVLVFPAGSGVGLEIFNSLRTEKRVRLVGAESDNNNHAAYLYDTLITGVPHTSEPDALVDALNDIIRKENIHCIFPAYDAVHLFLAQNASRLLATVVTSPLKTCEVCMSKSATYRLLDGVIPVPIMHSGPDEYLNMATLKYPVFMKPDRGCGSRGAVKITSDSELIHHIHAAKGTSPIVCEFLPGDEITVDCFSSAINGLIYCGARRRIKTVAGMSIHSEAIDLPDARTYANAIVTKLDFAGPWFFQMRKDMSGYYKLLEVAPRIAGAMSVSRANGVNFAMLSVFEAMGEAPIDKVLTNNIRVDCYKTYKNYYKTDITFDTVYVDLDDTLILHGHVNTELLSFLYMCVDAGKTLALVTRNANPTDILTQRRIALDLFDSIICVRDGEKKSQNMTVGESAVFIDDAYSERRDVNMRVGIPVFSCDMVEVLVGTVQPSLTKA